MIEGIDLAASYVASALWQIPVLWLAAWLVARMVRRLGAASEHRVWVAAAVLCVVVPALPSPRMHGHGISIKIAGADTRRSTSKATGSASAWSMPIWVPGRVLETSVLLWFCSIAVCFIRLERSYRRTRRLLLQAAACALEGEIATAWERCRGDFGINHTVVLESAEITGPLTFTSGGRNVLLLPAAFLSCMNPEDTRAAFAHECAHMQRRDFRNHMLLETLLLPVRFHPAMRLVRQQLAATREMACDAMAAASLALPQTYRGALLRIAAWIAVNTSAEHAFARGVAVGIFDTNSLEERMDRLKMGTPRAATPVRYLLSLASAAAMLTTASALAANGIHLLPSATIAEPQPVSLAKASTEDAAFTNSAKPRPAASHPALIHQVDPEFPAEERRKGHVGEHVCTVGLTVDAKGVPQNVHILHSAGEAFDSNAVAAVRQYRFRPAMQKGKPVAADLTVAVNYQLF